MKPIIVGFEVGTYTPLIKKDILLSQRDEIINLIIDMKITLDEKVETTLKVNRRRIRLTSSVLAKALERLI